MLVRVIGMLIPEATQVNTPGHGFKTPQIEVVWGRMTKVEPLGHGAGVHLASNASEGALGAGVIKESAGDEFTLNARMARDTRLGRVNSILVMAGRTS
jgi:hypothetical protein